MKDAVQGGEQVSPVHTIVREVHRSLLSLKNKTGNMKTRGEKK
jgi:hypothetical protein